MRGRGDARREAALVRIVMTSDTAGGVWTFAMTLARELGTRGHEVHVMTGGPAMSEGQRAEAAAIDGLRVHERASRLEWEDDPRGDLWEEIGRWVESLRRLVEVVDPDALHLNCYAPAAEAWEAPTALTAHSDVATWWRAVRGEAAPERFGRYRETVSAALERADAVVAPTRAHGRAVREAYGIGRAIGTIHNGIGPEWFASGDLEAKADRVLAAGRLWDEAKNLGALRAAAGEIRRPVMVAGEGEPGRSVGSLGRLDRRALRREMARSAAFAHPARYEPFGLAALEAAASGCALFLGDLATLRELWSGAAVFVSPDEPGVLAEAVNETLDHEELRRAVAEAGLERARRYTARAMGRAYEALYERAGAIRGTGVAS